MTKTHIIYIPFTGVGTNRIFSDEWLKDRIEIFKNYTLQSLLIQTNRNFKLWLSFRSEEGGNKLIEDLLLYINESGLSCFFTYDGLIYYDDKNEENNKTLISRLKQSLIICDFALNKNDYIYLTRLDSDDMLHKDVVQLIQNQKPFEGALTLQLGYVFNRDTGEVAEWNPLTNPPFHTIMFKREQFFDPEKHIAAYKGFKSHEDIAKLPHKVVWRGDNRRDRLYCVFTHNPQMHISTTWDHEFKGRLVDSNILKKFGIN